MCCPFCVKGIVYDVGSLYKFMEENWWWEWGGLVRSELDAAGARWKFSLFSHSLGIQNLNHFSTKTHGWCTIIHVNSCINCSWQFRWLCNTIYCLNSLGWLAHQCEPNDEVITLLNHWLWKLWETYLVPLVTSASTSSSTLSGRCIWLHLLEE